MIEAGAAGVHFEDQLASREEVRPHGRQGAGADRRSSSARSSPRGSPPTSSTCRPCSSRAPTRDSAKLLTSDVDARDQRVPAPASAPPRGSTGVPAADSSRRSRAASPTRRTPTCSGARPRRPTSTRRGSSPTAIHASFPGKLLAYNCSPSFNWKKHLDDADDRQVPARAGCDGLHSSSSSRWPASTRST